MGRKLVLGLIIMMLVILPVLVACSTTATTTTTATSKPSVAAAVATATTTATATYELRLSAFMPPLVPQVKVYEQWASKIAEATNGRVKITVFGGGTLIPMEDAVTDVKQGVVDMADFVLGEFTDQYPYNSLIGMPFAPMGDAEKGYNIWMQLREEFPEVKGEFDNDFKVLVRATTGSYALHTQKEVHKPSDLKGVKIQSGGTMSDVMQSIGAAPMSLPTTDWYTSLERGLLEGLWNNWSSIYETKCYTFTKYHTVFPSGINMGQTQVVMNLDVWNKLPSDIQQVFEDLSLWATETIREQAETAANGAAKEAMIKEGHTIITLTSDEEQLWRDAAAPIIESYLSGLEAKGYTSAKAIYQEALALAK